jgi:hypothetical protein
MENYKTVNEIQKILNLPKQSIYYLLRKYQIPFQKIGLRRKKYDFNKLKEILQKYYKNE